MTKKKGSNNLLNLYKESFRFIWDARRFFYFILGIFAFSVLLGYFVLPSEQIYNQILDYIQELIEMTQGKSLFELISFIFFNNLKSSFFGMLFGIIFGIFPIFSTFVNGYFLGFVSNLTIKENSFLILWRLLPHGVFELPAIFISLTLGLKLGSFLFQKEKLESLRDYFKKSLMAFFLIVLPLLVIAAIIEGILIFCFTS